eukprot:tig00021352_g20707.t1
MSKSSAISAPPGTVARSRTTTAKSEVIKDATSSRVETSTSFVGCDQGEEWRRLQIRRAELDLRFSLLTGQTFRWKEIARTEGGGEWRGVVRDKIVSLRQDPESLQYRVHGVGDPASAEQLLVEFFNLDHPLESLYSSWVEADCRFRAVGPCLPGARVLRQDPVECVFSFICSSNNNISRITSMVASLCRALGRPLGEVDGESYYQFPTLEALQSVSEEALREASFGYRAPWIAKAARMLLERGGEEYLLSLRGRPREEVQEALTQLPGVGKKVAACIALFSLDKHDEIPVDTHVWQIAVRHYLPHLKNKSLTPAVHDAVGAFFRERFGPYAGWAHNTLFVADLPAYKPFLKQSQPPPGEPEAAEPEEEQVPATKRRRGPGKLKGASKGPTKRGKAVVYV